jgi:hypothetical protein
MGWRGISKFGEGLICGPHTWMEPKGQNRTKMALRDETFRAIKWWKWERTKKNIEIGRGWGKNGTGNCIQLRKPEMEDRLLKRQQREIMEMKAGRKKCVERHTQMRRDAVDTSSEYQKEIGASYRKIAFNYRSSERIMSSKSGTSHAYQTAQSSLSQIGN